MYMQLRSQATIQRLIMNCGLLGYWTTVLGLNECRWGQLRNFRFLFSVLNAWDQSLFEVVYDILFVPYNLRICFLIH
jgi:hypothetical protein